MSASAPAYSPGLEGIVAAETRLSHVDGEAGKLILAGLPRPCWASCASWSGRQSWRRVCDKAERHRRHHRRDNARVRPLL